MSSVVVSVAIVSFLVLELVVLCLINRRHFLGKFGIGEAGAVEEVKLIAGRGLTLVGLSGATMAFLFGQLSTHPELVGPVFLVGEALVLFLTSFKLDLLGATWRGFFEAQTRCLGYGLIALTAGLAFAYGSLSPSFSAPALILPGVAAGWQAIEFVTDVWHYVENRKRRRSSQTPKAG